MSRMLKPLLCTSLLLLPLTVNASIAKMERGNSEILVNGDVELNFNYQDRESNANGYDEFNQDGRILLELIGTKETDNGYLIGFKAQPLLNTDGDTSLDDVYFSFGQKDSWELRAGRFEAYDMFPVGLDIFLEYSGDTSNDLYSEGSPYIYQLKESRGRGADGQVMYTYTRDNLYFEVNTLIGDRSNLFSKDDGFGSTWYHGAKVDTSRSKDSISVRPVIAYQFGEFKVAAAMETNLIDDAVITKAGVDISDRLGYGTTMNWTRDNLSINFNYAHMDGVDEENDTFGLNGVWNNFGLGYVYAESSYDNDEVINTFAADGLYAEGDVEVSTWYISYRFENLLDVDNFALSLGSYYTSIENKTDMRDEFSEDDDYGVRVRFNYVFD